MRWRRNYETDRPLRPKVRKLTADEREQLLGEMGREIKRSPVLTAFDMQVRAIRGRFYLEWQRKSDEEFPEEEESSERVTCGRITPLEESGNPLLLEVEHSKNQWSEVARGSARKLITQVASDTKGTFHGLGALDKSLRRASKVGVEHLPVKKAGQREFLYSDTGEACSVQEALYHYFKLPIQIIAQPRLWYVYHRKPQIVECSEDRTRVLVRFRSSSWSGETIGGTCLYLSWEGEWGAYPIRPNQSDSIAIAEAWLIKRKWEPWC